MLDENKQLYYNSACLVNGWEKMTRSELCNLYLKYKEENNPLLENCLSGIVYKFWDTIGSSYYKSSLVAAPEDAYEWVIESILYALDKHVWTDPNNRLYGDAKGPEKAIMVCVKAGRLNYYEMAGRQKRKLNYDAMSLDTLEEDASDGYYVPTFDTDGSVENYIGKRIVKAFNDKDYFSAFTLDAITNFDLFETKVEDGKKYSQFSIRKLKHHLRNIDDYYCNVFANKYKLNKDQVTGSTKYVTDLTSDRLDRSIKKLFAAVAKDKEFLCNVRGY